MTTGTQKINAANDIKKFLNFFRSLSAVSGELCEDLETYGKFQNAIGETESRLSALQKQEDEAKARLTAAGDERAAIIAQANDDAERIRAEARNEVDRAGELVAQGQEALSKAKAQAADLVADARKERERLEAEIRAELAGRVDKVLAGGNSAHP